MDNHDISNQRRYSRMERDARAYFRAHSVDYDSTDENVVVAQNCALEVLTSVRPISDEFKAGVLTMLVNLCSAYAND